MGKGGGGAPAQPTQQSVTQTNLPEYAKPYFENLMERGQTASMVEYQPYGGQRVADFSPMQQQAFQSTQDLGVSPLVQQGAGLTGLGANLALQSGQYNPMAPQQTYQGPQFQGIGLEYLQAQAPQLQQFQMGPAERVRTGSFAMPGTAERYMSPYMQNVVDIQKREAQRQADIATTQRNAQAVGAGAFGGSRQAIMDAEAARNLAIQKNDIQAQGLQSAFQQAQQAYQTDAARQLQAQQANQQAGLTTGQQNLAAQLQTQGLGAQTGMQAQQLNQAAQLQAQQQALGQAQNQNQFNQQNAQLEAQYGLAGLQAAEQSRQFGAGLNQQGIQQLLGAAGQLGQLGQTQFNQALGATQAQQQAGAIQQAQQQQGLDQAYEEFMRQQTYPQSQLQFYSSLLRGVPIAPQQTMYSYQAQPSMVSQLGGLGIGALGLSKAFAKDGGEIKRYADGGITGEGGVGSLESEITGLRKILMGVPDQRLAQDVLRKSRVSDLAKAIAMQEYTRERQAAQDQVALQQPRSTSTVLEDMGLGGLDIGALDDEYADGGIVAFASGNEVDVGAMTPDEFERYNRRKLIGGIAEDLVGGSLKAAASVPGAIWDAGMLAVHPVREGLYTLGITDKNPEFKDVSALRQIWGGAEPRTERPPQTATLQGRPASLPEDFARPQPAPAKQMVAPTATPASAALSTSQRAAVAPPIAEPKADKVSLAKLDPDAEYRKTKEGLEKAAPSELDARLKEFAAEAEQAKKDRDADRWLAVAMGGFATAAASSPYALKNFGEGLGLTAKEISVVNKEFRKIEQERKKAELALRQADRAEKLGNEKAALGARDRANVSNQRTAEAEAKVNATLAGVAANMYGHKLNLSGQLARASATRSVAEATREQNADYRREAQATRNAQLRATVAKQVEETFPQAQALRAKALKGKLTPSEQEELRRVERAIDGAIAKRIGQLGMPAQGIPGGLNLDAINAELARRGVK